MNRKMKELPKDQRPYERCLKNGPGVLSDSELLAVILRSGTTKISALELAAEILAKMEATPFPGLQGLIHISIPDLQGIHGIGEVKAVQLKCIGELARRIALNSAKPRIRWNDPRSIAEYYMEKLRHEEQEQVCCMMMDTKNHMIGEKTISKGTVNISVVSPREIFLDALRQHAVGIVLIHNHPSGDPSPSGEDRLMTKRVLKAGELVGISLLDHIIIGDHRYFSFREEGVLVEEEENT